MKINTSFLAAMVVLAMMFALGGVATGYAKAPKAEQRGSTAERCAAETGQLFILCGRLDAGDKLWHLK